MMSQLDRLDLRLLRVFEALLEERSVTRAAERLGVTQSAISHRLNQLREILGDQLFVRTASGMRPTPRAIQIGPVLREGLSHLRLAFSPATFEPRDARREFVIAASAYTSTILMPHVVRRVRAESPMSSIVIRSNDGDLVADLDSKRLDFAAGTFDDIPERLSQTVLMRERFIWVTSSRNPVAKTRLTLKRLAALPHIVITNSSALRDTSSGWINASGIRRRSLRDDAGAFDAALAEQNLRRTVALTVPDAQSAIMFAASTDMVAQLPLRLAKKMAGRDRIKIFEPPYHSPISNVVLLWHKVYGQEPALLWLRGILEEEAARL